MRFTKNSVWLLLVLVASWPACKKWDNHVAANEEVLNESLMQQINSRAELSTFSNYLVKTGLDKLMESSRNYTVWAPNNDALKSLASEVVNDTAKLRAFLQNHIAAQLMYTRMAADSVRVPVLNGKRIWCYGKKFSDANITQADVYVKNGVLNVVDKIVLPLQNIWQYIQSTTATYQQNTYVNSLLYMYQDVTKAELDSINPITGLPVYKPGTGMVEGNYFREKVYNVDNEDSLYTYIIFTNTAFTSEVNKQKPYFKSADAAITTGNASWNVVKDLAVKGVYTPAQLPATLLSKFNVHVPLATAAITASYPMSNGIVYVVNAAATAIEEKIPVTVIQGEEPYAFKSYEDKYITKIFYRQRMNPVTGTSFKDIYLNLGSSGAKYYVDYNSNQLYTTKYKVYWVALNDKTISGQGDDAYGTDSTLQQILQIGQIVSDTLQQDFNVQKAVAPLTYTEIYLGEYTNASYNALITAMSSNRNALTAASRRLRLLAPTTLTTGIPYNLTLDYIKLVPVF